MSDMRELLVPLEPLPRRTWNQHVYAAVSVLAASALVSFLIFVLLVIGRWIAHVTGVWPL